MASRQEKIVVELGGGFGGLAYYLIRDNPQVTYLDFDLPEATALASYYLMRSLPSLSIQLYGEVDLGQGPLNPGLHYDAEFRDLENAFEIGRRII
jgi:hypothetical protein